MHTEPKVGDITRYGVIVEVIPIGKELMMRSDYPYGTWPIELIPPPQMTHLADPNKINDHGRK